MAKLTKNSSGSWMKISASWGSESGGKIWRSPSNGLKNGALTPAKANSSWHRASSPRMIRM